LLSLLSNIDLGFPSEKQDMQKSRRLKGRLRGIIVNTGDKKVPFDREKILSLNLH